MNPKTFATGVADPPISAIVSPFAENWLRPAAVMDLRRVRLPLNRVVMRHAPVEVE